MPNSIDQIVPAVRQVFDAAADNRELCASFEVQGDSDRWVQITAGVLNLAYPLDADPTTLPARLGARAAGALMLVEWERRKFATFNIEAPLTAEELAHIVDAVFQTTLGCADKNYGLSIEVIEVERD